MPSGHSLNERLISCYDPVARAEDTLHACRPLLKRSIVASSVPDWRRGHCRCALRLAGARSGQVCAGPSTRWRSLRAGATVADSPLIDAHIHLFDPTRPQGAPYSGPRPAPGVSADRRLPRSLSHGSRVPLGVVGAIKVEASPWIEDNLWVLEVAQRDPIIVGVIGNLEPDKPEFPEYLERYHKNPLFRGIRYGNLWGRDITKQSTNPDFIGGLKRARRGGPRDGHGEPARAAARSDDPNQRRRADAPHRARSSAARSIPQRADRAAYDAALQEIGKRPQIFVKLSEIIHRRERPGFNRARHLPRAAGHADGCVRRRPHPLRQRLAQQRRRGAGRQGASRLRRSISRRSRGRRGEVLLEELGRSLQVGQRDPSQPDADQIFTRHTGAMPPPMSSVQ